MNRVRQAKNHVVEYQATTKDYEEVKGQYEFHNRTDHPEYRKICEWLKKKRKRKK